MTWSSYNTSGLNFRHAFYDSDGHQAILVGINTVLADNPHLTVRPVPGPTPQPVILDSHLRCPLDCHLLAQLWAGSV